MKNFIKKYFPVEALIPLAFILIVQCICYYTPKLFVEMGWYIKIFDFTTQFDIDTPWIPEFIVIYVGCFLFWFFGIFVAYRVKNKKIPYDAVLSLIICHFVCLIIYLLMPTTTNIRPDMTNYTGNNVFKLLCKLIYSTDSPYNLFPSMHVTVTWFCYIAIRGQKDISLKYRIFSLLFSFAIFASILFTKQHYVLDILPSIILCEIIYFIVKKTNISVKFKNICFKINNLIGFEKFITK